MRGTQARNIARDADLFVVPVEDLGAIRVVRGVLEVGPGASPDAIATIACRRLLQLDGIHDEGAVRQFVEHLDFAYVPERERRKDSASDVAYRAVS